MEEKNRFSSLLEQLMSVAELKNYTLAQELQYDVSYISKWVSGRMIPAEKTEKKVLQGISRCIVTATDVEGQEKLLHDYHVDNLQELEMAIYDNLEAEYNYVKDLQKNTGTTVSPKTFYYIELTLPQFISKMRHPVLRRVKSLDIMAAMDLMAMNHEYRLQIVSIENGHLSDQRMYPDVHFSLLMNLEFSEWDYVYDTIFLINMLTNFTHIDFQLYGGKQACGRSIFTVKDDFAISGMLMGHNRCVSVAVSEDADNCNVLYYGVKAFCSREQLLFRKTTMREMLIKYDYVHTLLSPNPRWLVGHMTEHFLPDDLFEEILEQLADSDESLKDTVFTMEDLRSVHCLNRNILEESKVRVMIYESAFSSLAVSDELDFYNYKVHLSVNQRLRYMEHLLDLCMNQENLEVKLVYGRFVSDFQYIADQCVFLSDVISYLRLDNSSDRNNLVIINRADMQNVFDQFYEEIWNKCEDVVVSDKAAVDTYIRHVMQGIRLISRME
ncbi:MAG: hypothetical protein Q4F21_01270 [Lachnospiraceae bacterium]|nr:hypothetical protein [Lachnospiraceae bacterium]